VGLNFGEEAMDSAAADKSLLVYARIAGFMYLFVMAAFLAGFGIAYHLIVPGNFTETARNIIASERLCRVGLSSQLIASWTTILLAGAFYALLRTVHNNLALFALLWRVAEAVVGGVITIFSFMALSIYTGRVSAFGLAERQALVNLLLRGYTVGFYIAVIYFSLGSIIFFYLLLESRFIPRILSAFGIVASVLIPILGFASLIFPERAPALTLGWAPMFIAEIATGLWLLIAGANLTYWNNRHQDPRATPDRVSR